jgi:phosphoribosylformimino-5-aminoimidazole carboxamide ribonucleotide (ProFAR) isomerase
MMLNFRPLLTSTVSLLNPIDLDGGKKTSNFSASKSVDNIMSNLRQAINIKEGINTLEERVVDLIRGMVSLISWHFVALFPGMLG